MAQDTQAIATGIGSWPGTDVAEALRVVVGELADLPYLPELPARGPGADLVGRAAARLVDLPVDLQPSGWRLVGRPGRDQARAAAFWREDLDRMAHAFEGRTGPLKIQLAGPYTLGACLWLPRGDRALSDPGARRDLVDSTAVALAELVAEVRRLVPGASPVVQLDEPALPAVLGGRLRSASGFGVLRAVPPAEVRDGLSAVLAAARAAGASTCVHCCADDVPVGLLQQAGAGAISLDTSVLRPGDWDSLAEAIEQGVRLWAGILPTRGELPGASAAATSLARTWREVGLSPERLREVVITPSCGLVGHGPDEARATLTRAVEVARVLTELSGE